VNGECRFMAAKGLIERTARPDGLNPAEARFAELLARKAEKMKGEHV
jgi:hypothetical protein